MSNLFKAISQLVNVWAREEENANEPETQTRLRWRKACVNRELSHTFAHIKWWNDVWAPARKCSHLISLSFPRIYSFVGVGVHTVVCLIFSQIVMGSRAREMFLFILISCFRYLSDGESLTRSRVFLFFVSPILTLWARKHNWINH